MTSAVSVMDTVVRDVYIPSVLTLLAASVMSVLLNTLIITVTRRDSLFPRTIRRWSRALWLLQKSAFVLVQPTRNPLQPQMSTRRRQTGDYHPPKRSRSRAGVDESLPLLPPTLPGSPGSTSYQALHSDASRPVYAGNASFFRDLDRAAAPQSEEDPEPASVTAVASPVVVEVLRLSRQSARLESQRLVFPFHPAYLVASACKCFVVLVYIQYHLDEVEGGWVRVCVCGAANAMAGLTTPVLAYAAAFLLQQESPDAPLAPGVVAPPPTSDDSTDSVFIVQLLHQISRVELNDLSTVFAQGTAFVIFAAVLLPVGLAACVWGAIAYAWMLAAAVALWLLARRWYRASIDDVERIGAAGAHTGSSKWRAIVGGAGELAKAFAMKALTMWLLNWSLQATLLLGVGLLDAGVSHISWAAYVANARRLLELQAHWPRPVAWAEMDRFKRICACSLLIL